MTLMDAFTALAEPTRRSIVEMVARQGALTVTEISRPFRSSRPAISQHLKVLRDADFLRVEKRGRRRFYRLNVAPINEIDRWVERTKRLWNGRLDRLDQLLARETGRQSVRRPPNRNNRSK